ncbi:hypothetical protein F4680DRAFT_428626 [Xylaria scruposa]|nr:hypothetical protein F4680DRAFT_428626 [Xylaria scruposa]
MSSHESASATSDSAAPSFPQFPKLPLELRIMIWKFAMPGPRNYIMPSNSDDIAENRRNFYAPLSEVCFESRRILSEVYVLFKTGDRNRPRSVWYSQRQGDRVRIAQYGRLRFLESTSESGWYWEYNEETREHTYHFDEEGVLERQRIRRLLWLMDIQQGRY